MVTCQITFLPVYDYVPLKMWYNFCWKTDELSLDEIDTILTYIVKN